MAPKQRWSARPSRTSRASRIIPAQVPSAGMPAASRSAERVEQLRWRPGSFDMVVDSPPGMHEARRPRPAQRGCGPRRASAPSASRALRRARANAPCRARTPTCRPAPGGCTVASAARRAHQPRSASLISSVPISRPGIAAPRPRLTLARMSASRKWVVASTMALARGGGVVALEDARAHEHGLGAELHDERGVGRGGDAAGAEHRHRAACRSRRSPARAASGAWSFLAQSNSSAWSAGGDLADVAEDRAQVAHGLDDVAGAGLALRADHARALGDAAQRLAEVGGAAHERHGERPLVDVVGLVGRGEHLGLVDVVDAERLEDLGLDEVADAGLGHHRDGDDGLDALDHLGVAHAGDAAVAADVGGHALERHDGARRRRPRRSWPARRRRRP